MLDAQVLVVGGGPVGMATGLAAARHGLSTRVIDQYQRSALHTYAPALHPGTLRLLDELGLAEELVPRGTPVSRVAIHIDGDRVGAIDLSRVGGRFPFALMLPQVALEGALEAALRKAGVEVDWKHQALSLESGTGEVTTLVGIVGQQADDASRPWGIQRTVTLRSAIVVGADGYSSTVRRLLGARYVNVGAPSSYALFEFPSEREMEPEIQVFFGPDTTDILWPIDAHRGRWTFQIPHDFEGEPDRVALAALVEARAPWFSPLPGHLEWATTVCFERRLVDRFGEGRMWLVGEAAHLTTPLGVHNMNVGMHEGHDLVRRLRGVLSNGTPLEALELYSVDRRDEWLRLLAATDRIEVGDAAPAWARKLGGRLVDCIPASGEDLGRLLDRLGMRLT